MDSIKIFTQQNGETSKFKSDAIFLWEDITQLHSVWALNINKFINIAAEKFSHSFTRLGSTDSFSFDAQQTQFIQFLKTNNYDIVETSKKMISFVLHLKNPNIITIMDFAAFFAKFGPEDSLLEKIHQLLCCSKSYNDWFRPQEQHFSPMFTSGSYSNTFSNCFIIKRTQGATYHIYNLPNVSTRSGFLIDETGKTFLNWHAAFESFGIPHQPMGYPAFTFDPMDQ